MTGKLTSSLASVESCATQHASTSEMLSQIDVSKMSSLKSSIGAVKIRVSFSSKVRSTSTSTSSDPGTVASSNSITANTPWEGGIGIGGNPKLSPMTWKITTRTKVVVVFALFHIYINTPCFSSDCHLDGRGAVFQGFFQSTKINNKIPEPNREQGSTHTLTVLGPEKTRKLASFAAPPTMPAIATSEVYGPSSIISKDNSNALICTSVL